MIKKSNLTLFLIILVVSTTACVSNVKIRLFTANLSPEDTANIEEKLQSLEYYYSLTATPFPRSIKVNSIIYNPSIDSNKKVYNIIDVLESEEFHIFGTSLLSVENHSFTPNNIGVYLFSEGYEPPNDNTSPSEINEFGSYECGSNLTLNDDSTFNVDFDIWDYELEDYRELSVLGVWETQDSGNIVLNSEAWKNKLFFKKKISIESSTDEKMTTISLIPIANNETNGFYLKKPDSELSVNCPYRTYLIN